MVVALSRAVADGAGPISETTPFLVSTSILMALKSESLAKAAEIDAVIAMSSTVLPIACDVVALVLVVTMAVLFGVVTTVELTALFAAVSDRLSAVRCVPVCASHGS